MYFSLIKDATNMSMYGDIPEVLWASEDEAETYYGDEKDGGMLCEKLLPAMYENMEDCLLDYDDVDYYDAQKCVPLKKILEGKLQEPCEPRLRELYTILYGYVKRAIELGTGVVIEL